MRIFSRHLSSIMGWGIRRNRCIGTPPRSNDEAPFRQEIRECMRCVTKFERGVLSGYRSRPCGVRRSS